MLDGLDRLSGLVSRARFLRPDSFRLLWPGPCRQARPGLEKHLIAKPWQEARPGVQVKHWFEAFFASKAFVTAFFRVSLLLATQAERGAAELATTGLRPAASELSGGKILW